MQMFDLFFILGNASKPKDFFELLSSLPDPVLCVFDLGFPGVSLWLTIPLLFVEDILTKLPLQYGIIALYRCSLLLIL